jgi:hypothetical protein
MSMMLQVLGKQSGLLCLRHQCMKAILSYMMYTQLIQWLNACSVTVARAVPRRILYVRFCCITELLM